MTKRWRSRFVLLFIALVTSTGEVQAQQAWNSVTLTWTTPGDDGLTGTAAQFDIRYATSPINASNFASAARWSIGVPLPAVPGTSQSAVVTGLSPSTTYYFAIKTGDEVPNWAGVSNVVSKTTAVAPDVVRPAALAISVPSITDTTATVAWSATGDDSLTGTATTYDVRWSTSPITTANFASATAATGAPAPAAAGTAQSVIVTGLSRQVTYYFAARVADEAGNWSALSNVPTATTPDTKPPAAISDLVVGLTWLNWSSAAVLPRSRAGAR
jgi:phosphodiesterase/alkaline phosphatase D-like protein